MKIFNAQGSRTASAAKSGSNDACSIGAIAVLRARRLTLGRQVGEKQQDAAAELAIIGAAQRVEHYEISGYTTARNLASQLRHSAVSALLSQSLAEEENADQLLNQVARSLMSVARMPAALEQATAE